MGKWCADRGGERRTLNDERQNWALLNLKLHKNIILRVAISHSNPLQNRFVASTVLLEPERELKTNEQFNQMIFIGDIFLSLALHLFLLSIFGKSVFVHLHN